MVVTEILETDKTIENSTFDPEPATIARMSSPIPPMLTSPPNLLTIAIIGMLSNFC